MVLSPIKADNLSAERHGFFTRIGGGSTGIYEGLNCGIGSNDDKEMVYSNRQLVANTFDLDKDNLVSVYQVHSADAVHVTRWYGSAHNAIKSRPLWGPAFHKKPMRLAPNLLKSSSIMTRPLPNISEMGSRTVLCLICPGSYWIA